MYGLCLFSSLLGAGNIKSPQNPVDCISVVEMQYKGICRDVFDKSKLLLYHHEYLG